MKTGAEVSAGAAEAAGAAAAAAAAGSRICWKSCSSPYPSFLAQTLT